MSTSSTSEEQRIFWGKMIWISAIFLVLSIIAGVTAYVVEVMNTYTAVSISNLSNPSLLISHESTSVFGSIVAVPFIINSLAFFCIAVMRHRKFSNPTLADSNHGSR